MKRLFHKSGLLRRIIRKFSRDPLSELKARGLKVGSNVHVMGGVFIDPTHCWHITIGDTVTLAPGVRILAHDASTVMHLGYARIGKVDIGNRVFVGADTIVLPGVSIGNDVIVGAGSVVSRDIPDDTVALGSPATAVCTLSEYLERKRQEMQEVPCFGEEYTMRGYVSDMLKDEMNDKMTKRIGYVS